MGVARQYCGATGKIDNCQVAVYLAYASAGGHTLLDERLYLPEDEWAKDAARREEAGVPEGVVFRTKPELASELIRSVGPRIRHGWVTFDEGYGKDPEFLSGLEESGERYIGEVPKTCRGWLRRPEVQEPGAGRRGRRREQAAGRPGPTGAADGRGDRGGAAGRRLEAAAVPRGDQGDPGGALRRDPLRGRAGRPAGAGAVAGDRAEL